MCEGESCETLLLNAVILPRAPGGQEVGYAVAAAGAVGGHTVQGAGGVVLLRQLLHDLSIGGVLGDIVHLLRVFLIVDEQPLVGGHAFAALALVVERGPDTGEGVALRADAVVAGGVVLTGLLVEGIVERAVNELRSLSRGKERHKRGTLHGAGVFGSIGLGYFEQSGGVVDILHHGLTALAGGDLPLPAHDERHAHRLLENPALVVQAVLAQVEALVTHVNHERVFGQPGVVQVLQQGGDGLIERENAAEVVLHVPAPALLGHVALGLVFAGAEVFHELLRTSGVEVAVYILQAGFNPAHAPAEVGLGGEAGLVFLDIEVSGDFPLELAVLNLVAQLPLGYDVFHDIEGNALVYQVVVVPVAEVPAHALAVVAHELGAVAPVIVQGGGRGHLGHMLLDDVEVAHGGQPVAVGGLVTYDEGEGLAAVAALHPGDSHVGHHISHIATHAVGAGAAIRAGGKEGGVQVITLAGEHLPGVEAGGAGDKVPLAHNTGLVAGFLQHLGVGRLVAVEGRSTVVVQEPVVV